MTNSEIATQTEHQLSPVRGLFQGIENDAPPVVYEELTDGRLLSAWSVVHEAHSYLVCRVDTGGQSRWWGGDYRTAALSADEQERIGEQIDRTIHSFNDYEGVKLHLLNMASENHKVEQPTSSQPKGIAAGIARARQELRRLNNIDVIAGVLGWDQDRVSRVGLEKLGPPVVETAESIFFLDSRKQRVNDLAVKYSGQSKQWFVAKLESGQHETLEYYNSISPTPEEHWVMCIDKAWQASTEAEVAASIQGSIRPSVEEEVA